MTSMVQIDIRAIRQGLKAVDDLILEGDTRNAQQKLRFILEALASFNYNNPDARVIYDLVRRTA